MKLNLQVENHDTPKSNSPHNDHDDDYDDYDYDESHLIPESFPLDFNADLSSGVHGLPPELAHGDQHHQQSRVVASKSKSHGFGNGYNGLPSLKVSFNSYVSGKI